MIVTFEGFSFTFGVVPVLVGPLQALLALLPALLVGLGAFLAALFTPAGFRRVLHFLWRQKLFTLLLVAFAASCITGWPWHRMLHGSRVALGIGSVASGEWPMFRGDPSRTGSGPLDRDPTTNVPVWNYAIDPTVYSSPAVAGDLVIVSTATDISPFNPTGRGAIVAVDALSGVEKWRYAPDDYRATFSSPVVSEGFVICGEGLHQVQDARITCLDLNGRLQWEFRTSSHVESTAAIANGRVFVGAGADGFYCLELRGDGAGGPRVLWHLEGKQFPDCESSPLVVDDLVIFGLGEGGQAVCAVNARTGELQWRIETPYPMFTSPTLIPRTETAGAKLAVAMGNGNFVQSAAQVRDQQIAQLREAGATPQAIAEAERKLAPGGQVWCVDLATQAIDWRYLVDDTILGSIAARDGRLYFGCRDGSLHCLSSLGPVLRRGHLHEPTVCSPALGHSRMYLTTSAGRLFALELDTLRPVWDISLGEGENFTSSPVISHGHVYVGSQQQGLMCLGAAGRLPANLWNRGDLGGVVEHDAPPSLGRVANQWPTQESPFEIKTPLTVIDGQILAVVRASEGEQLTRLAFDAESGSAARVVWQVPSAVQDRLPPLAIGSYVITLEYANYPRPPNDAPESSRPNLIWPQIVARHFDTGDYAWRMEILPFEPLEWTCDLRRIYLLGSGRIAAVVARDGIPGWSMSFGPDAIITIALADDIVLMSDGVSWNALDSDTGISLWRVDAKQEQTRMLDAQGTQFLTLVKSAGEPTRIQLRRILDGGLIWQAPWPESVSVAWARMSGEQALVASSAGNWQVYRLADGSLVEFDKATELSQVSPVAADTMRGSTLLFRSHVLDVRHSGFRMFGLDDRPSQEWISFEETGRPTTPMVAVRGRVFFANEQGKILCVGPRGSTP